MDVDEGVPPRLLLVAGATGCGKSTLAVTLASELGFARILSTDAIREVLRTATTPTDVPALHRSSFTTGDVGDPVNDWIETCDAVRDGVKATVSRARREGHDLLLEGVHLVPAINILSNWRKQGGLAVGITLVVRDEGRHIAMIQSREERSWRNAERYLAALNRIRRVQDSLIEKSLASKWSVLDVTLSQNPVEEVKQLFNLEWYGQKRRL